MAFSSFPFFDSDGDSLALDHKIGHSYNVNLILFDPAEMHLPLARSDPRARHVLEVLRRQVGDTFDVGLIDGPRGKGMVVAIESEALQLQFTWSLPPPPLDPLHLIIGLPRPQTARKILQEATTLGIASAHFVTTERGEPNYAQSSLWRSNEWRRHVVAGAEQAFCTRLPHITYGQPLGEVVAALDPTVQRVALDNYESPQALAAMAFRPRAAVTLVVGSERGWTGNERDLLRNQGFLFAHLGDRVLRTETAVVAALVLLRAKLGLLG